MQLVIKNMLVCCENNFSQSLLILTTIFIFQIYIFIQYIGKTQLCKTHITPILILNVQHE